MIRNRNNQTNILTETDETIDKSLVETNFQDMQEQIAVIQEQLQVSNASNTSLATVNAYSDMILLVLDKIYNQIL